METKRTVIRPFTLGDLPDLAEMMASLEVMRFTGFARVMKKSEILPLLERWMRDPGVWCVCEKKKGDFIGWWMLKETRFDAPELGFMVTRKEWGKGYATEVSQFFLEELAVKEGMKRVVAVTSPENLSSQRVLKKIGMRISLAPSEQDEVKDLAYFEIDL